MSSATGRIGLVAAMLWAALPGCGTGAAKADSGHAQVRTAFTGDLPRMDGARLRATVLEVAYGPGGASPPHRHPCPGVGYVVQGNLRTQVTGGRVAVHRAGETFYEAPNAVHLVSANASDEKSVRFLAIFVCDGVGPLSEPER